MKATLTILALIGGIAAPAAGAHPAADEQRERMVVREIARLREVVYQRGAHEQTDRTTRTLKLGPSGELHLANLAGPVVITRGGGSETTLEIVRTSRAATVESARDMLGLVTVDVTERGTRAEVRARYPETSRNERRSMSVSVAYTVTAPADTRITIRSLSGDIRVTDIQGDLFLETISGDVEIAGAARIGLAKTVSGDVTISRTRSDGAIEAASMSGDVTLREVQARRVRANSISGALMLDGLQCERAEAQSMSGDVVFRGALAKGGRYDLKSHSGSVRLALAGDVGFDIDANSFGGTIRSDLPLKTQGGESFGGSRRRSFRGVFGDGSATVTVTTFSGGVIISRQ